MKLSETPGEPGEPAPLLGQHTQEVLKELLGMDHAAFHSLAEKTDHLRAEGAGEQYIDTALIAVPVLSALIGGFGLQTTGFIVRGIQSVSAVAGMFIFGILYFGIMTDAGMLDSIVDRILAAVGTNPLRIVASTALLALLVHLDGSGAVTFLVTIPVRLPLYQRR